MSLRKLMVSASALSVLMGAAACAPSTTVPPAPVAAAPLQKAAPTTEIRSQISGEEAARILNRLYKQAGVPNPKVPVSGGKSGELAGITVAAVTDDDGSRISIYSNGAGEGDPVWHKMTLEIAKEGLVLRDLRYEDHDKSYNFSDQVLAPVSPDATIVKLAPKARAEMLSTLAPLFRAGGVALPPSAPRPDPDAVKPPVPRFR